MSKINTFCKKNSSKTIFLCLLVFSSFFYTYAQQQYKIVIHTDSAFENLPIIKKLNKSYQNKSFSDTSLMYKNIYKNISLIKSIGYISANIDSIVKENNTYKIYLFIGKKYYLKIINSNVVNKIFSLQKNTLQAEYYPKLVEKVINYFENNGFPFVSVYLDSISIKNDTIIGKIIIDKGQKTYFDSIIISGNAKISEHYLQNYLDYRMNKSYDERIIKKIPSKLREVQFLEEKEPSKVVFIEEKAKLYLNLAKKSANLFSGIVGFNTSPSKEKQLLVNGELLLNLKNALYRGEEFLTEWYGLPNKTQDLKINIEYPFIFKTPFGISASLKLYKKDTSFVNIILNTGIKYIFTYMNYTKLFIETHQSNLLGKTTQTLLLSQGFIPYKTNLIGIESHVENYDYRINPSKGFGLTLATSAGYKNFPNNLLSTIITDTITKSNNIFIISENSNFYFPITKQIIIKIGNQTKSNISKHITENELFRLGGFKTLRGFDQDALKASFYSIVSTELRLLTERNSHICTFFDIAYTEKKTFVSTEKDFPYGFGVGMTFETKAGIFSFYYATGTQKNNPIDFRNAKIHFGINTYF